MKTIHKRLLTLVGILFSLAVPTHLIYLTIFVEASTVEAALYAGITAFGVLYTVFGISFLLRRKALLFPALIVNVLGITSVLVV